MHRRRSAGVVLALVTVALALSPSASGYHFAAEGWRHQHYLYPPVPSGQSQIVNVFGQPCNSQVNDNQPLGKLPGHCEPLRARKCALESRPPHLHRL